MNNAVNPEKIYWIESVVRLLIADEKKISNVEAFDLFSKSKTHSMLIDKEMEMWFLVLRLCSRYGKWKRKLATLGSHLI